MIRRACVEDISAILVLARKFFEVAGYQAMEFDLDTCAERLIHGIEGNLCFVAESNHQVVGFVLGAVCPSIFNKNIKMGVELAWWIDPQYRNGVLGVKLLKAIEKEARNQGVSTWSMICLEALEPDKVESIYQRLGYERAERTFVRRF